MIRQYYTVVMCTIKYTKEEHGHSWQHLTPRQRRCIGPDALVRWTLAAEVAAEALSLACIQHMKINAPRIIVQSPAQTSGATHASADKV